MGRVPFDLSGLDVGSLTGLPSALLIVFTSRPFPWRPLTPEAHVFFTGRVFHHRQVGDGFCSTGGGGGGGGG